MTTSPAPAPEQSDHHDDYETLLERMRAGTAARLAGERAVFTTDAAGLYTAYLDALPAGRQRHTCSVCRRFIEAFGGLVTIAADGQATPLLWEGLDAPAFYAPAVQAMARLVRQARVTGVFVSSRPTWGVAATGAWTHFAVEAPAHLHYASPVLTPPARAAELREDYQTMQTALAAYRAETVDQALTLLRSEQLYRAERVIGPAEWLARLHADRAATRNERARDNLVWLAVATAPPGFAHPRSSMIGTLLDDIAAGMDFAQVAQRFAAKMHPLLYQRPQAAPGAGNIAQAERRFAELGLAPSLRRRYARLDEVEALWRPAAPPAPARASGLFGHLIPKGVASGRPAITIPPITMTWEKFARVVLPEAQKLDLLVPSGAASFGALVTAADPEAPPILQWDRAERRNPASWYLWTNGSPASQWGLQAGAWHAVTAVAQRPAQWYGGRFPHQGQGVILLLEGARDANWRAAGLVLFPETLRAELHPVRATIEAHSKSGQLEGADEASACGLIIGAGTSAINVGLQVTTGAGVQEYTIDRWD